MPFAVPYPPLNTEEALSDSVTIDNTADDKALVTPKYVITHRGAMDLQDYTTDRLVNYMSCKVLPTRIGSGSK